MWRAARIVSGVVAVILVVGCGAGGPSEAELQRSLVAQLSRAWEVESFDVEGSENVGVSGAPIVKAQFGAQLHALENTYMVHQMEGDVALIKPVLSKGERRSLYGTATSVRYANGWQTMFSFESNARPHAGKARSELGKRTVVMGTGEERRYRAELEEQRRREVEANRRAILAVIAADRVLECEQVTTEMKAYPCRFKFASVDEKTGAVVASNRWFSLKTGVLKPQNSVRGTIEEDALHLTEQIKRSETGKSFIMHYTLRLSKAHDQLLGEFTAPGGKGSMRCKL